MSDGLEKYIPPSRHAHVPARTEPTLPVFRCRRRHFLTAPSRLKRSVPTAARLSLLGNRGIAAEHRHGRTDTVRRGHARRQRGEIGMRRFEPAAKRVRKTGKRIYRRREFIAAQTPSRCARVRQNYIETSRREHDRDGVCGSSRRTLTIRARRTVCGVYYYRRRRRTARVQSKSSAKPTHLRPR